MIITVSGTGGSGKSSIAKRLAKELGFKHYSLGDMQREIAKQKGLTITELNTEEQKDPAIDNMIDQKASELAKIEDNFVIDGWLAACFIPDGVNIFLDGDVAVRAKRILGKREAEELANPKVAEATLRKREMVNHKRWLEFYNFDYLDKKNYDLVVDTTSLNLDEVFEKVSSFIDNQ